GKLEDWRADCQTGRAGMAAGNFRNGAAGSVFGVGETGPGPECGVEFPARGFGEGGGFGEVAQDGEDGGSGAAHHGGGGFRTPEEPLFQLGEEAVFRENGALEVVDEFAPWQGLG